MNFDVLRRDNCQQGLDDLKLNAFVGLWAHEAVADGRHDAIDEKLARVRRIRDVPREVSICDEFLQAIQRSHHDSRGFALAGELEGQEVLLCVDRVGRVVLGHREGRRVLGPRGHLSILVFDFLYKGRNRATVTTN